LVIDNRVICNFGADRDPEIADCPIFIFGVSSPPMPPLRSHLPDSLMLDEPTGISLPDRGLDVLELPLLNVEVSINRLVQKAGPITTKDRGQGIKGLYLLRIELETYDLLFHIG